ncbi:hypothetical protein AAEX28_12165 [Lentisphaerota bacterium WC36G]|nr:hypothetical protein LJT99_14995 [Lentisphaerae bacterium WC36]
MKKLLIIAIILLSSLCFLNVKQNKQLSQVSDKIIDKLKNNVTANKNDDLYNSFVQMHYILKTLNKEKLRVYEKSIDKILDKNKNNVTLAFAHFEKGVCINALEAKNQNEIDLHLMKCVDLLVNKATLSNSELNYYYTLLLKMSETLDENKFKIIRNGTPKIHKNKFVFEIKNGTFKDFKSYKFIGIGHNDPMIKIVKNNKSIIFSNLQARKYNFIIQVELKSGVVLFLNKEFHFSKGNHKQKMKISIPILDLKYKWENNKHIITWSIKNIEKYNKYKIDLSFREKGVKGGPSFTLKPNKKNYFIIPKNYFNVNQKLKDYIIEASVYSTESQENFSKRDFIFYETGFMTSKLYEI